MRFFAFIAAIVSVVCAERFTVMVGDNNGLTYTPESVTAQVGDTIAFRFMSKNHTVTQSTFAKPCEKMSTPALGVDSGFQLVPPGATAFPEWSFTLDNASAPLWFFCNQAPHCSRGMVFAVNPTAEKSFSAFKATAMGAPASPSSSTPGSTGARSSTTGTPADTTGASSAAQTGAVPPNNGARSLGGGATAMLVTISLIAGLVL